MGGVDRAAVVEAADGVSDAARVSPPARTLTVLAGGDILTENQVLLAGRLGAAGTSVAYDFGPVLSEIAPVLRWADLAICHMETPLGVPGQQPGGYGSSPFGGRRILAPYEMASALHASGFDRCSTASNHSYDLGKNGIGSTLAALDDAGITHAGTARTRLEADPAILTINGVQVAHLSYTEYSNTVLSTEPWVVNISESPERVARDVRAARGLGAEIVIVSLHLKQEMQYQPAPADRLFVTDLTDLADIDLVVQHGPHVVQPVEIVNGTVVYWSVGNFLSGMGFPRSGKYGDHHTLDGLLATVRFTERASGIFDAEPFTVAICNELLPRTVRAAVPTLADPGLNPGVRRETQACLDRTIAVVGAVN